MEAEADSALRKLHTWFGGKKAGGGRGTAKGSCGPRERIARVEAGLEMLDTFAQDQSALLFDWDNCESVAHVSQRNSLLNTLVADISDRSPRQSSDPPSWRHGIWKKFVTRSVDDKCGEYAEKLLNQAATPLQHRGSSPRPASPSRGSNSDGAEPHRVSLMFWPPEFIPAEDPSCHDEETDDDTDVAPPSAPPPDSPHSPPTTQPPATPPRPSHPTPPRPPTDLPRSFAGFRVVWAGERLLEVRKGKAPAERKGILMNHASKLRCPPEPACHAAATPLSKIVHALALAPPGGRLGGGQSAPHVRAIEDRERTAFFTSSLPGRRPRLSEVVQGSRGGVWRVLLWPAGEGSL
ncbi:hypothetical protein T484DRAFT_1853303 [Baffinella frigidus]|nr:hypothetical protein T484DRAFT_1853303 [Cryptophyta sp. CCMP2293]